MKLILQHTLCVALGFVKQNSYCSLFLGGDMGVTARAVVCSQDDDEGIFLDSLLK